MPAVTCSCPHCSRIIPYTAEPKQRCPVCRGTLAFADFNKRMKELCSLERIYKLQDPRPE